MAKRVERHYRGEQLARVEWGLWRSLDRPGYYLSDYRPQGRKGRRIRRWAYVDGDQLTVDDLRDHHRGIRAQISTRRLGMSVRISAEQARDLYLAELRRRNCSDLHHQGVARTLRRFLATTGIRDLARVDRAALEGFLQRRHATGVTPPTLNRDRAELSGWFKWAIGRGLLQSNPVAGIPRATVDRRVPVFPLPRQMTALVRASSLYYAGVWTLLAFTGLRLGSFLAITPDCFRRNGIFISTTKRRREWHIDYGDGCPLWGPDLTRLGRRIWETAPPTKATVRRALEAACRQTGVRFTPKAFRHAFVSWLSMMGESYQDIAAWAHHSTARTTEDWYAHLRPRGRARQDSNRRRVAVMWTHCLTHAQATEKPRARTNV